MASFIIEGGHPLKGEITPQGAKNEALEVICATLLTSEEVRISNIPEILDVLHLTELMRSLGVEITRHSKGDYSFRAQNIDLDYAMSEDFMVKCAALRGSVMLVGPLLARFGTAVLAKPGGDKIGRRRVDTHLSGMCQLGATLTPDTVNSRYTLEADKLRGANMILDEASVTGTANIIMAAVLAKGTTTIYNAACEPYIQHLCQMLNQMGARISGISSNLLTINGVDALHGTTHAVSADMIEVGSFIGMSVMLGGGLTIRNVRPDDLGVIPRAFQRLGVKLHKGKDFIRIPEQKHYSVETFLDGSFMTIDDAPWPGLTPDLLSVLIVVATQARGTVLFHQKMFESRLFFVDRLIDMGAQIILCDPHRAVVVGHDNKIKLRGRRMASPDIRAGIALLIAALSADGVSHIDNVEQIDRGYEDIDVRLNALGANIKRN
jgi:UDP-N-acetylglucosamine 1-carboxyvinyltransferase